MSNTMRFTGVVTSPTNLHDNANVTDKTSYLECSPFARWVWRTSAIRMLVKAWTNIYSSFPAWAQIGVYVNGVYYSTMTFTASNGADFTVDLPRGLKTVELVPGLQSKPSTVIIGSWLKSVYFSGAGNTVEVSTEATETVIYGDSITVGGNSTTPPQQAWPVLLRAMISNTAVEAHGWRTLYDDAVDDAARIAFVAKLATYYPSMVTFISLIGTNDFGLDKWTAADFGTAYTDLVDRIHSQYPAAQVILVTPLSRTGETTPNASGSALPDYRTQIAGLATGRDYVTIISGTGATMPVLPGDFGDGLHPTTAGHVKIASTVRAAI